MPAPPPPSVDVRPRRRGRVRWRAKSYLSRLATVVATIVVIAVVGALYTRMQGSGSPQVFGSRLQPPPTPTGEATPTPSTSASVPAPVVGSAESAPGYRFVHVDALTGRPIRFNPCERLEYIVNPDGAPPEGLSAVNEAIDKISQATGIELVSAGLTPEVPSLQRANYQPQRYGERWAPIVVAWRHLGKPSGNGHGFGAVGGPGPAELVGTSWVYVSGNVMVNLDASVPASDMVTVLMHELGHVMGLDHTTERGQIMFPEGNYPKPVWGTGDLAGLQKLGRPAGCLPEPKPGRP